MSARQRILLVVQNLPVPFDRRVWLEAQTLRDGGYDVVVVCPTGHGTRRGRQVIDGITVHAYPPYAPGGGALGFVLEYAWSFLATARMVRRARRAGRFAVMQACNPPDIFWPIARWLRRVDGTRFVFDHHDLCPELYRSRFPEGARLPLRGLEALERATFRTADRVVSTNESYAAVARTRGDKPADHVTVVRTGPDPQKLRPVAPRPELRRGRAHLAAYVGVMGPQDGVDVVLAAADHIVHRLGRTDVYFELMGSGDCHEALVAERDARGLKEFVHLPGRVSDEYLAEVLSTADVGLSPDPLNPLNDVSTMNKTMEYLAFGLPVVAYDLVETRVSAQDAAVYADPRGDAHGGDPVVAYADALLTLLDDAPGRRRRGLLGRARVEEELAWEHQAPAYLSVFDELTHTTRPPAPRTAAPEAALLTSVHSGTKEMR